MRQVIRAGPVSVCASDLPNKGGAQLGADILNPQLPDAPLLDRVLRILFWRSGKKVQGIDASCVVAPVANEQGFVESAVCQFVGYSVGENHPLFPIQEEAECSIVPAVECALPQPALIWSAPFYFCPKPRLELLKVGRVYVF